MDKALQSFPVRAPISVSLQPLRCNDSNSSRNGNAQVIGADFATTWPLQPTYIHSGEYPQSSPFGLRPCSLPSSRASDIYSSVGAPILLSVVGIAHPRRNFLGSRLHHGSYRQGQYKGSKETGDVFSLLKNHCLTNPNIRGYSSIPRTIVYRLEKLIST